jgi:hypothetical protein
MPARVQLSKLLQTRKGGARHGTSQHTVGQGGGQGDAMPAGFRRQTSREGKGKCVQMGGQA